ncbi:hypothetical protein LTR95_010238 [Oleoguttula sp. CCFEE 5521]
MIADFLPGVSITVSIDDRPLREFAADTEVRGDQNAGNTTTAYIEATHDAEFRIDYNTTTVYPYREDDILLRTSIDADARPSTNAKDSVSQLGEIRIALYRCLKSPQQPAPKTATPAKAPVPANAPSKHLVAKEISEKALKGRAISCRAGLSDAVAVPRSTTSRPAIVVEYPFGDAPIATYRFLYRSHRDLQIEQIIERSPTPPPLEERDVDTLTIEEARELAKRLKALQAQARVKPEAKGEKRSRVIDISDGDDDDSDADAEVSFTSAQSCRKKVKVDETVELVDLS